MQYRLGARALGSVAMALLALVGSARGSDDPEAPSDPCVDTKLDYAGFGKPFISTYCASCHAASVKGNARLGAPVEYVFDTPEQVAARAAAIKEQVVLMKAMPFGASSPKPSDAERAKLGRWLDCVLAP